MLPEVFRVISVGWNHQLWRSRLPSDPVILALTGVLASTVVFIWHWTPESDSLIMVVTRSIRFLSSSEWAFSICSRYGVLLRSQMAERRSNLQG